MPSFRTQCPHCLAAFTHHCAPSPPPPSPGERVPTDVWEWFVARITRTAGGDSRASWVRARDLYRDYAWWCRERGGEPASQKALAGHLVRLGCVSKRSNGIYWSAQIRNTLDSPDNGTIGAV